MAKKCKLMEKNIVKEEKREMASILDGIKSSYKSLMNKGLNVSMVGSAKRNLVFRRGDSPWDIDWSIYINKNAMERKLGGTKGIKDWFYEEFKKKANGYNLQNSTSVITLTNSKHNHSGLQSHDVAILYYDSSEGETYQLIFDKITQNYIWNIMKDYSEQIKRYKLIKGEMWTTLRAEYLRQRCEYLDIKSYVALSNAINHTLQVYEKEDINYG